MILPSKCDSTKIVKERSKNGVSVIYSDLYSNYLWEREWPPTSTNPNSYVSISNILKYLQNGECNFGGSSTFDNVWKLSDPVEDLLRGDQHISVAGVDRWRSRIN